MTLRIDDSAALVRIGAPRVQPGGWSAVVETRGRQGQQTATTTLASVRYPATWGMNNRILTAEQLWRVYQACPEVRACINSIVRRLATWDWEVDVDLDQSDKRHEAMRGEAVAVHRFLEAPNTDGETWQDVVTKFGIDWLVYDAGAIELVADGERPLAELTVLRGSDIRPKVDETGRLVKYVQDPAISNASSQTAIKHPEFEPDELVFVRLFPTTASPEGFPLIESLFQEIITLMRSSDHVMRSVDADEIPPGILVLSGMAGEAYNRTKAEFEAKAGADHKLRILASANTTGVAAEWIEMRHTPKDLTLLEVVAQVRRTVWRTFGVTPIEMGETENTNRASGEVLVDVGSSHLLEPMLERLEAAVNARIVPLLLTPEAVGIVKFRFKRERKMTESERKTRVDALVALVNNGTITRNEARALSPFETKLSPLDGGNVPTVVAAAGVKPLAYVVAESESPEEDAAEPGEEPDGEEPGEEVEPEEPEDAVEVDYTPDEGAPDEDDETPGEVAPGRARPTRRGKHAGALVEHPMSWRAVDNLPSEWVSPKRFKGKRTLDLRGLGDVVIGYTSDVTDLWRAAQDEALAAVGSALADGKITHEEVGALTSRVGAIVDALGTKWGTTTQARYRAAAAIGARAAGKFADAETVDATHRANVYHARAMGWLTDSDGPLAEVRNRCVAVIQGSAGRDLKRGKGTAAQALVGDLSVEGVLGEIRMAWAAVEHRIDNWAGRLVELANATLNDSLLAEPGSAPDEEGRQRPVVWWVEWCCMSDSESCDECAAQQAKGFQRADRLRTTPGGDTPCRARCRCTLVYWTGAEVRNGTAQLLGPLGD